MKKKILFATQRDIYPFFVGGAEISAHTLLSYLVSRGHECLALGTLGKNLEDIEKYIKRFEKQSVPYEFISRTAIIRDREVPKKLYLSINMGYTIKLTLLYNFAKFFFEQASRYKPNLVITQMMGSGLAVRFSHAHNIPCIHIIRDVNTLYSLEPFFLEPKYIGYADIFSNSKFVKKEIKKRYKTDSTVLYPSIKIQDYKLSKSFGKYITLINPHPQKGVDIFLAIAKGMPNYPFLIVEGWEKLLSNSLPKLKNLKIMRRQFDMKRVYKQTKLLLIPSLCQEAFGRIVVEAQVSGIPVIASNHSGLPESVGKGGVLIDDFQNPDSWIEEIKKLYKNNSKYESLSKNAIKNACLFDVAKTTRILVKKFGI